MEEDRQTVRQTDKRRCKQRKRKEIKKKKKRERITFHIDANRWSNDNTILYSLTMLFYLIVYYYRRERRGSTTVLRFYELPKRAKKLVPYCL